MLDHGPYTLNRAAVAAHAVGQHRQVVNRVRCLAGSMGGLLADLGDHLQRLGDLTGGLHLLGGGAGDQRHHILD